MLWRATVQQGKGFSPQQQQAQAGDALFWFNEDEEGTHQPVPDSGAWNIAPIPARNSSDQLSLANPGTYPYHCAVHPDEKGSVVVANACLIGAGANPLFGTTTIVEGQCVSWGNSDSQSHQPVPVSGGAPWTNPIQRGDLSESVNFPTPGNIDYRCALHPDAKTETGTMQVAKQTTIAAGAHPLFASIDVKAGQGVAWLNNDSQSHQPVTSDATLSPGSISAGTLSGVVFFNNAGTFAYTCQLHPGDPQEVGTINVTS